MFLLVILAYAILIMYEFIPMYKQKLWKDFWVNSVLCLISFTTLIILCFGIKIPSPEAPIRESITSIFGK